MNLAFPTLLIFLLLLPGLFFINSYYKVESQDVNFAPISQRTGLAVLFSLILHFVLLWVLIYVISKPINPTIYIRLLSESNIPDLKLTQLVFLSIYIISSCFIAFFSGIVLRKLIINYKLDKKWKWLRFNNKWYYFFKAYDFRDEEPEFVEIFAMVNSANQCYVYRGILEEFYLDNKGNLDLLILSSAKRTLTGQLNTESNGDMPSNQIINSSFFHPIEGDYFLLKYPEIINLNIFFLSLSNLKNIYNESR